MREQTPRRTVDPVANASPPVPDRVQRAVAAALAAAATETNDGGQLLLGGLALLTLALASGAFLVLLARASALESRP